MHSADFLVLTNVPLFHRTVILGGSLTKMSVAFFFFFGKMQRLILKVTCTCKGPRKTKTILRKSKVVRKLYHTYQF